MSASKSRLPNYFLADLPPGTPLSPGTITEACQTLRRNRAQYLASRSTASMIETIADLAASWRQPEDPFRQLALELGPAATGFSAGILATGLDAFFGELTRENLEALMLQELGHLDRLDRLAASDSEGVQRRAAFARGPELLVHVAAGNIPTPTLMSMVLGLLLRSAQIVKCATGTALIPRLLAHSLYAVQPKLAACLELVEWPGGTRELEEALFAQADCVTATGAASTLEAIRARLPQAVRYVPYGHRVSFGFVHRDALTSHNVAAWVTAAAEDVMAWNQHGCLSPHAIYAEFGGRVPPEDFARLLADELARLEQAEPRGALPAAEAAPIVARRSFYEVRAAYSPNTRLWCSPGSTAWTVVYESDAAFQVSCLNRFIYVKGVADVGEALRGADPVRGQVSTVGLAASAAAAPTLAQELARWGVARVCPLGRMQRPPLAWRHDGRPVLGDWIAWTDWER